MQLARYLSERGNFTTLPFNVSRFVLMSSKESTGGGPYVTEEVWPLRSASFNAGFENGQDIPAANYHFPASAAE
jgi:2'-5' RNA ligase